MSNEVSVPKKRRRTWREMSGAFGRAHRKASAQLENSVPLLQHLDDLEKIKKDLTKLD